eukprot:gnl/TRDRNA2_/TRDRNA2_178872_c0_seq1.p2 gnl/TRDRNA2_/TRDRNA2_178872_c0~~gnl/TRDRNA2_/TRDRNA2_178872_c0_seq1.p2  ORF type:complete len:106 (+),score=27.86 gnl/TRDRNA2_/TRDRNA2_178872_c0_seq1:93-410(+)
MAVSVGGAGGMVLEFQGAHATKRSVDFNRPVVLSVGAEPPADSPHQSTMLMETFFKRYYGEAPPQAPFGSGFKPGKDWYEHTLQVNFPDPKLKKKKAKAKGGSSA